MRACSTSEHWLTLMTCTVCHKTPDYSPIYKCTFGHTVCYECFQNLASGKRIPVCNVCDSDQFTRQDVSSDFLRKLKTKPGIGRPFRYQVEDSKSSHNNAPDDLKTISASSNREEITVEQLFQLDARQLQQLFDGNNKEKLKQLNSISSAKCPNRKFLKYESKENRQKNNVNNISSSINTFGESSSCITCGDVTSRKPLRCPHDSCRKIIAVSSFLSHFRYEHFDIPKYNLERGKEIDMDFDAALIETDKTVCLGILRLFEAEPMSIQSASSTAYDLEELSTKMVDGRYGREQEVDTFWLMVSASADDDAYILFWLFNGNEDFYNCTLELASEHDAVTMTTFCGVNGVVESQNPAEIVHGLNCLFVTEGTVRSMLSYGVKMKIRIIIH